MSQREQNERAVQLSKMLTTINRNTDMKHALIKQNKLVEKQGMVLHLEADGDKKQGLIIPVEFNKNFKK